MITYCYNSGMADQVAGTHFGKRLKYYRRKRRLTQNAIAAVLEVAQNTVSAWEQQDYPIADPFMLSELAELLLVPVDELTGEREPLVLHENGVEYEIAKQAAPNTDADRLYAMVEAFRVLPAHEQNKLIEAARNRLPAVEDTGE